MVSVCILLYSCYVPHYMYSNCWPEFFGVESFSLWFLCFKFSSETSSCECVLAFFSFVRHALVKLHTFQLEFSLQIHENHTVRKWDSCVRVWGNKKRWRNARRVKGWRESQTTLQSRKRTHTHRHIAHLRCHFWLENRIYLNKSNFQNYTNTINVISPPSPVQCCIQHSSIGKHTHLCI